MVNRLTSGTALPKVSVGLVATLTDSNRKGAGLKNSSFPSGDQTASCGLSEPLATS